MQKKALTNLVEYRIICSMVKIIFKHWKTGELLEIVGQVLYDNPASARLVVQTPSGKLEDIIKSTIVSKKEL